MKRVTFTPEQVAALEKSNKCKLIHITVFLDDNRNESSEKRDRVDCLLKDPLSLPNLQFVSAMANFDNGIERGDYMIDNLWVDGDKEFQRSEDGVSYNNSHVRYTAAVQAVSQVKALDAAVVKH
jgi:hypothetical protein